MFEKYSVSIFETKTETGLKCAHIEIYDEYINIYIIKKVVFCKKDLLDFFEQNKDFFTTEEYFTILSYTQDLTIPKRKHIFRTGVDHDDPTNYQHEPSVKI
jgi:hypothetical protein